MLLAHFQVGRSGDGWVIRFGDRDYPQPSRDMAIKTATTLATMIARLEIETVVFIEPVVGEDWTEWRPHEPLPELRPMRGMRVRRPTPSREVPYLRLISGA